MFVRKLPEAHQELANLVGEMKEDPKSDAKGLKRATFDFRLRQV